MKIKSFGTKKKPFCKYSVGNGAHFYKCSKHGKDKCPFQKWCVLINGYDFLAPEAKQNCKEYEEEIR